uniref:Uncharacterized protein n=1 Tax=Bubo bubo TaxID=30461 RepID=A0A8C0F6G5_BUBBB
MCWDSSSWSRCVCQCRGTHCPKADPAGFEDDHDQTAQEIPVNEVPENEGLSPTRVTDRVFFTDIANILEYLEELHREKNLIVSIPRNINCLRHMKVLLDQNDILDICEELGELKCLLSLDLSNKPLSFSLLPVISKLESLCQLRLYKTNLQQIPVQIWEYFHHVELLGLSDNNLKCLPKEIVNLTKLKEIFLQKNRCKSFLKELCHIANLEIIDLELNRISLTPEEGGFLTNLVKLFLAFNNLSSIPPTLQHCQNLGVLDLSQSPAQASPSLEKSPHQICRWPPLSRVYLRNTGLHTVPGSFTILISVRILDLSENCFDNILKRICTVKNVEVLALADNQIQEIPAEVKELRNLKCLNLSENQFNIFLKQIFLLESLERLHPAQNKGIKFTSLPEDIKLHIENNCLNHLPTAIGSLTHLKIPDCPNSLLQQLPDSLCRIEVKNSLQKLLIQNILLSQLPEDLDSLQQLELVLGDGNPMTDLPIEVCCQGTSAIWEYLQEKRCKTCGLMNQKGIGPFLTLKNLMKERKKEKKRKKRRL